VRKRASTKRNLPNGNEAMNLGTHPESPAVTPPRADRKSGGDWLDVNRSQFI
jgi:hypothetical protein